MLTVRECRKHLSKEENEKLSDSQVEELRDQLIVLSDIAIDCYLAKRNKNNLQK